MIDSGVWDRPNKQKGNHGDQARRFTAIEQGPGRLVHRHRPHRPPFPGARTVWHTHPLGQTLVVLSGLGRTQREGGLVEEIRPGDVVWFAPNERHWHGAGPTTGMNHIAIQEALDGKVVEWMEPVSDEQYRG